jgi:hypothetical protein
MRWPISAWVRSPTKRRSSTSRSRGVTRRIRCARSAILGALQTRVVDADRVAESVAVMVVAAARRLQRDRPVGAGGFERFEDLLVADADLVRDLSDGGPAVQCHGQVGDRAVDSLRELYQLAWNAHRPCAVTEVAFDLAQDGRHGVAREGDPALEVEACTFARRLSVGALATTSAPAGGDEGAG